MKRDYKHVLIARYYHTARTAHLERLAKHAPGAFYYSKVRADFDEDLAASLPWVHRKSAVCVALSVVRNQIEVLEVPEALAVALWPQLVFIHLSVWIANKMGWTKTRIVSYAIENYPTDLKLSERFRTPRIISQTAVRLVAGLLVRTTSRIVFGTEDARTTYERQLGTMWPGSCENEIIWAIPSAMMQGEAQDRKHRLVFLGTFENRKGITQIMEAWPIVAGRVPTAELTLLGKGGILEEVSDFAQSAPRARLIVDPTRQDIFNELKRSKALVLPSQPAKGWKEQVGLPIVEGLSAGCEIVSSDETGIASWLSEHEHQVVPWWSDASRLSDAIVRSLLSERTPQEITDQLPDEDGRLLADKALFRP